MSVGPSAFSRGLTRGPRLVKGALVELTEPFLGLVPRTIPFQYNPTELGRELAPWWQAREPGKSPFGPDLVSQPFDPKETFQLELELDAADELEHPEAHPQTVVTGIAERLAALEMLLYPAGGVESELRGRLRNLIPGLSEAASPVPKDTIPIILFIWGRGRVLPVRITAFSVQEQAHSPTLYPLRATVTVGLLVLPPEAFTRRDGEEPSEAARIAIGAYRYTRQQKEALASLHVGQAAERVSGLLPF